MSSMHADLEPDGTPHDPGGGPRRGWPGLVPAVVGFAAGWAGGYLAARFVADRILSGADGFSGLALALSIAGFLRIGVLACALIGCFVALRVRRAPNAAITVVLALAAWWLVTALLGLTVPATRAAVWIATLAAVLLTPLVARAAALRIAGARSMGAAAALAVAALVVSSVAATAIGEVSSDRAVQRYTDREQEREQIDFTPYVPGWLPADLPPDRDVFGPIGTSRDITLSYGSASNEDDPHHVMLMEMRAPVPCGATGPSGAVLACTQIGGLADGTAVHMAELTGNPGTVWIVRDATIVILLCHLEPFEGCVRTDGSLDPEAVRILESLTEATYTPPEPFSADPPSLDPAGG